jgi:hypothetical protein
MPIYIYALIDPFTSEVRYIGKSIRPKERLQNHCNERSHCHRTHWLQSLKAKGARPIQQILQTLPDGAEWQPVERRWIAYGRAVKWPLTNSTDGGDGVPNLSGESKARMAATWRGRKHRPESLTKIGAASRGRVMPETAKQVMREKMQGRVITWGDKISQQVRKLAPDQVREIRARLRRGDKQYVIAADFGVDKGTISNIKRGLFYTDVPDTEAT